MTIDFTNCTQLVNTYEGADFKRKVIYDGSVYMLKFGQKLESDEKKPLQASYSSAPVSEYLGSHIYEIAGLPVQETLLGTYNGKVVVACRDFIENLPDAQNYELIEFKKLENSFLDSSTAGGRTPLYDNLIAVFANHDALHDIRAEAENRYWKMFTVDALIGNFDRHAGNWGYILNKAENRIVGLAPVYDCGSCLYPQLNENAMEGLLADRESFENRTMTFPTAALRLGKKKVHYHEFMLSAEGTKARAALGELLPKIDFEQIRNLIAQTPYLSDARREFYTRMVELRRDMILQPAYELFLEERKLEKESNVPDKRVTLKNEAQSAKTASMELSSRYCENHNRDQQR